MIRLVFLMSLICGVMGVSAETAYVTDILLLGLHEAEDTSGQPFRNLESGAELNVLERVSDYALVQTADGEQGWVKSAYLVADKPARLRLTEVEALLEIMRNELIAAQDAESHMMEGDSYEALMYKYRGSVPILWVVAALVVVMASGFLAGMWCLDALIRRRHGGFRIY